MPKILTIPDFKITVVDMNKRPTGATLNLISAMISFIEEAGARFKGEKQVQFYNVIDQLVNVKSGESITLSDNDFDFIKTVWELFEYPVNRSVAMIEKMLREAKDEEVVSPLADASKEGAA